MFPISCIALYWIDCPHHVHPFILVNSLFGCDASVLTVVEFIARRPGRTSAEVNKHTV